MAESRFDIQFSGELVQGVDPSVVRERLRNLFKLSPEALERLMSGRPLVVKRDLDPATAARYRDAFRDAGAILHLTPSPATGDPVAVATAGPQGQGAPSPGEAAGGGLTLAPPGADVEQVAPFVPRDIDTAHLSLIPGQDWTLEDCVPPPGPTPIPDTSHLALTPIEPIIRRVVRHLDE